MSTTLKILMILTSHAAMGESARPTGVWFEELSTPYYAFVDAGAQVDIVSIQGGAVPVDPHSVQEGGDKPASVTRFMKDAAAMHQLTHSPSIEGLSTDGYAAIFMPGGHGTMWDLPESTALAELLSRAWQQGKVIAAVCHGPAGLVNLRDAQGQPVVAGRRVAGFSNTEEDAAGLSSTVPFLLETRLRELGARYEKGPDFQAFAVRDGQLVTGQNPASSEEAARLTLQAARQD